MMGDQNDKQRCCFWWFMEAREWGGMKSWKPLFNELC